MTTPQAGQAAADPQAYRERLLELLGARKPVEVLAQRRPTWCARMRRRCSAPGRLKENDSERVYGYRLRLILHEDNPTLLGMNQDLWVAGQQYNEREPLEFVGMFRAMRHLNLALWNRMSPADLQRTGRHNERGSKSLDVML